MNFKQPTNGLFPIAASSLQPVITFKKPKDEMRAHGLGEMNSEIFIKKYDGRGSTLSHHGREAARFVADFSLCSFSLNFYDGEDIQPATKLHSAWKEMLKYEEKIKDRSLFWSVFGELLTASEFTSFFPDEINKMVSRNDRMNMSLADRTKAANRIFDVKASIARMENNEQAHTPMWSSLLEYLNSIPDDEPIKVFRGFLCRKELGKRIRKSDVKGSADYWTQVEGAGTSYSFDPEVALRFAGRRTDFDSLFATFLNIGSCSKKMDFPEIPAAQWYNERFQTDEGKIEIRSQVCDALGIENDGTGAVLHVSQIKDGTKVQDIVDKVLGGDEHPIFQLVSKSWEKYVAGRHEEHMLSGFSQYDDDEEDYWGFDVRPMLGTYSVFKEHILAVADRFNEREVVVLPENVMLDRYEFITTREVYKTFMTRHNSAESKVLKDAQDN